MSTVATVSRRGPLGEFEHGQKIVLHDIDWDAYELLGDALGERPIFLTYDRGVLEIMTLSPEHERYKYLYGRLIDILGEEFELPIGGYGSTTQKRKDLLRGLEADQCYYVKNLHRIRGKKRLNLERDPPPDLILEIDVTHSSLDRMKIYEALKVPEVWRFETDRVQVYVLKRGKLQKSDSSPTFPGIDIAELFRFVQIGLEHDDPTMARAFRAWVREQLSKE